MIGLSSPRWQGIQLPESPGLVAGFGLRATAAQQDLVAVLDACLATVGADRRDLVGLATLDRRSRHPALMALASTLDLPLFALHPQDLHAAVPNPSARVTDLAGLPSVAEAAAMAFGPLLVEKQRGLGVTAALSRYVPVTASVRSSASSAASMLDTSSAGP